MSVRVGGGVGGAKGVQGGRRKEVSRFFQFQIWSPYRLTNYFKSQSSFNLLRLVISLYLRFLESTSTAFRFFGGYFNFPVSWLEKEDYYRYVHKIFVGFFINKKIAASNSRSGANVNTTKVAQPVLLCIDGLVRDYQFITRRYPSQP